jgi:hypothetical protein
MGLTSRVIVFTVIAAIAVTFLMISPVGATATGKTGRNIKILSKSHNFSATDDEVRTVYWTCKLMNKSRSKTKFDLKVYAALKKRRKSQKYSKLKGIILKGGESRKFNGTFVLSKREFRNFVSIMYRIGYPREDGYIEFYDIE